MKISEMKNPEMYEELGWGIECRDGWKDMLNNLTDEIKEINPDFRFSQIKEKFGTLRAYCHSGGLEEIFDIIDRYEDISAITCEICGNKGTLYTKGWMKVRCDKCKDRTQRGL